MSMTEEEQIAQMKDWWQRNGKPLLTGGALALALVFGWQAWQQYQTNQAQGAGALVSATAGNHPDAQWPAGYRQGHRAGGQAEERLRRHPLCPVRESVRRQGSRGERQAG